MIRSLPSLKVIVLFICLYYKLVSFRGLYRLRPRPDWSLLGVKFKISDEHPRPFYMGVPPGFSVTSKKLTMWRLLWLVIDSDSDSDRHVRSSVNNSRNILHFDRLTQQWPIHYFSFWLHVHAKSYSRHVLISLFVAVSSHVPIAIRN